MRIKAMSWNIWQGRNIKGAVDHIGQENPHIIGLQEVTEGYPERSDPNTAYYLQKKLRKLKRNYHVACYSSYKSDRHETKHEIGNAILSKYPMTIKRKHYLSDLKLYKDKRKGINPRDAEPRIAVEVVATINNKDIKIINTHLALSKDLKPTFFTNIQTKKLIEIIGDGENIILMGDFNITPENEPIEKIRKILKDTDPEQNPTWPLFSESMKHHRKQYNEKNENENEIIGKKIDYIFVSKEIGVKKFSLGKSFASDHKSLIAILEI